MTIDFISIPNECDVPLGWTVTPKQEAGQVDEVARSYFANWTDEFLDRGYLLLNVGKVVAVLGVGASIFFVSDPV